MNRKIKLIWDFHGTEGKGTADHHVIHLKQFMLKEALELIEAGVEITNNLHAIAFMTVNEKDVMILRDALKPHRALIEK